MQHLSTVRWIGWLVAAALMAAPSAVVADQSPDVETSDEDLGFGEQPLGEEARFAEPERVRGRVDRRLTNNPLAGRLVGWRSGYIAPQGSVVLTNRNFYGQSLEVSVTDDVQLSGEAYLPLGNQTYSGFGGQFHVASGEAWDLTVGLQGRYRRTNFAPGTADGGLGLQAVFDVIASDNTTWSAGVAAHIPVYQMVEDVDLSACEHRREWAEGGCGTTQRQSRTFPLSGYWGALYGGINHFVRDWLVLNVEAFTGVSQGNFWALESALDSGMTYEAERRLVEETDFQGGLGPLGLLTVGTGTTWRFGGFAAQTALYFTTYRGEAQVFPWLSMAYAFGRE